MLAREASLLLSDEGFRDGLALAGEDSSVQGCQPQSSAPFLVNNSCLCLEETKPWITPQPPLSKSGLASKRGGY